MAEIKFLMKQPPCPSASATHRQTRWGLHQHGWSNDACATPQRWLRHELAWIWTNFLSEQRRATGLVEKAGGAVRAGGKRQSERCSRKTHDELVFMATKLLHRYIGAHARVHIHFLRRVCMHFWQVLWAPCMCRCVRQKGVVNISVHISFTLATLAGCVYASVLIRLSGKSLGMIGHFFWLGA